MTLETYDPVTKTFFEDDPPTLHLQVDDLNAGQADQIPASGALLAPSGTAGIAKAIALSTSFTISGNALNLARVVPGVIVPGTEGQALIVSNGLPGWADLAAGVAYAGTAPISVSSSVVSIAKATSGSVGVVKPGANLAVDVNGVLTAPGLAPARDPIFLGSITLPTWTTGTRPSSPLTGMEGFATDTGRRETWNSSTWVQYLRTSDIPAASGQLLGGSGTAGTIAPITVGTGLQILFGTTLTLALPTATTSTLGGVKVDGTSIAISGGGIISATGTGTFTENIYTASGAIDPASSLAVVNSDTNVTMTLAAGLAGHRISIVRAGAGVVTLQVASLNFRAATIVLGGILDSDDPDESLELINNHIATTYYAL